MSDSKSPLPESLSEDGLDQEDVIELVVEENSSCQAPRQSLFFRSFSTANRHRLSRISISGRVLLALLGSGLFTLLITAFSLQPAAKGFGTHQQLGLPACSFVVLYGRRCPSCGMTTSWSHLMHGQLPCALQANVGGTLLGIIALVLAPWSLVSAMLGRAWLVWPSDFGIILLVILVSVVTMADWSARLFVN